MVFLALGLAHQTQLTVLSEYFPKNLFAFIDKIIVWISQANFFYTDFFFSN